MKTEIKKCQSCKQEFRIEPEDFAFYEKIHVPPPTWCPECRLIRRLTFLNHNTLNRRTCDLCKKNIISMYPEKAIFPVYCPSCWWSDKWSPMDFGAEYDFSKPFFEQFHELRKRVPHDSLFGLYQTWINSEYNNLAQDLKNCYLLFNSDYNEDCSYGSEVERSKDCVDITMVDSCELSYWLVNAVKSYQTYFSIDCEGCQNVWFSRNLSNCSNCFGCINLRNKQYCIFNKQYSREVYFEKLKEFDTTSYKNIAELLKRAQNFYKGFPARYMHGRYNTNVSGDYIYHTKNVRDSYIATEAENCRYCMWLIIKSTKDCYDYTQFGENAQNLYDALVCGKNAYDVLFSSFCVSNIHSIRYSEECTTSSFLFGCIALRNKQYCILNKQYTKEEYEKLIPRIIDQMNVLPFSDSMERTYGYGEFFPPEHSPFTYNESMAQEYFPLTKDRATGIGYSWIDSKKRDYKITIPANKIPDRIEHVTDSIINDVIGCESNFNNTGTRSYEQDASGCTEAFRIIPQELAFYRKSHLPLPHFCPKCRHYQRIKQRNPLRLWHRVCQCAGKESRNTNQESRYTYMNTVTHLHGQNPCPNEFETSYAPERPEIVYCEACYNAEVA